MASHYQPVPPRPITPGDVVATFSPPLGEWTAAQITHIDVETKLVGVLELDWSGAEPRSIADLGHEVSALRLTHHRWDGRPSLCNFAWVLPRGCTVIGSLPLLYDKPSWNMGAEWQVGDQLARQRRWDYGLDGDEVPWEAQCTGADLDEAFDDRAEPRTGIRYLSVTEVGALDCAALVRHFPNLSFLGLWSNLGTLSGAASLNELPALRTIAINNLFGMNAADCLLPQHVPALEYLSLQNIPADYADAMQAAWEPELRNGTLVDIRDAREPHWIAENQHSPLREWVGRPQIGPALYRESVDHYNTTKDQLITEISGDLAGPARIFEIGRAYGEAFNTLHRQVRFISWTEREELLDALGGIVTDLEDSLDRDLSWARASLVEGVEDVRRW